MLPNPQILTQTTSRHNPTPLCTHLETQSISTFDDALHINPYLMIPHHPTSLIHDTSAQTTSTAHLSHHHHTYCSDFYNMKILHLTILNLPNFLKQPDLPCARPHFTTQCSYFILLEPTFGKLYTTLLNVAQLLHLKSTPKRTYSTLLPCNLHQIYTM